MKKSIAYLLAAMFAFGAVGSVVAADKPTAEQCKKDPKMEGCPKK